jgi:lipoate-protein ligase A
MDNNIWRLMVSDENSGAWNMALDEAILETTASGQQPPTLRLYSWKPACLSLGHAQPADNVDRDALAANGWDLVRRPTGGRAILHVDELTYSICAPLDHPLMAGGVLESYRRISAALIRGVQLLGISARADSRYDLPQGSLASAAVCFEVPSSYEITADGKKLIGSAQARRGLGVLQHGSLPLVGDLTRITSALVFPSEDERKSAGQRLLAHAATAESVLGAPIAFEQAARCMANAFQEVLQIRWVESDPTTEEIARAGQLKAEKYAHPQWTFRI